MKTKNIFKTLFIIILFFSIVAAIKYNTLHPVTEFSYLKNRLKKNKLFAHNEKIRLKSLERCLDVQHTLLYKYFDQKAYNILVKFQESLRYHLSNDGSEDDFLDWMNGWINGYYLAFLKLKDLLPFGERESLRKTISLKFLEMVYLPAMKETLSQFITLIQETNQRYLVLCASEALEEIAKFGSKRNNVNSVIYGWSRDGVVLSVLDLVRDSLEEKSDKKRTAKNLLALSFKQAQHFKGVKNSFDTLRSGWLLQHLNQVLTTKSSSKHNSASFIRVSGGAIGGIVGKFISRTALEKLAEKGFMGKTSVALFKISNSKIVSKLGMDGFIKGVSGKAASFAGGKVLFLVANKAVTGAVIGVTLGLAVILDYLLSKGAGALQRSSMEETFSKSFPRMASDYKVKMKSAMNSIFANSRKILEKDIVITVKLKK